ncbi:MAG: hypothetical protein KC516_02520, partial [Nanoarchaeota archaeon]|nr:hypothetical protein [Nanoarchaeota archaeon]
MNHYEDSEIIAQVSEDLFLLDNKSIRRRLSGIPKSVKDSWMDQGWLRYYIGGSIGKYLSEKNLPPERINISRESLNLKKENLEDYLISVKESMITDLDLKYNVPKNTPVINSKMDGIYNGFKFLKKLFKRPESTKKNHKRIGNFLKYAALFALPLFVGSENGPITSETALNTNKNSKNIEIMVSKDFSGFNAEKSSKTIDFRDAYSNKSAFSEENSRLQKTNYEVSTDGNHLVVEGISNSKGRSVYNLRKVNPDGTSEVESLQVIDKEGNAFKLLTVLDKNAKYDVTVHRSEEDDSGKNKVTESAVLGTINGSDYTLPEVGLEGNGPNPSNLENLVQDYNNSTSLQKVNLAKKSLENNFYSTINGARKTGFKVDYSSHLIDSEDRIKMAEIYKASKNIQET